GVRRTTFATPALATGIGAPITTAITAVRSELPPLIDVQSDRRANPNGGTASREGDRRMIREPYRQGFGRARTEQYGRPAGWMLMMSAIEKVFFPATLLIMAILGWWEALVLTVVLETLVCVTALAIVMKGQRAEYVLKGLAVTPLRYALIGSELVTIGRFACDVWITNNRKWRK